MADTERPDHQAPFGSASIRLWDVFPPLLPHSSKRQNRRGAFTLIEVMLAIAIMAIVCGTIYQFTGTVLRSSTVATRLDSRDQAFAGLRRLLDAQFAVLPANESRTFVGVNVESKGGHRDALQLVCPAGNALLTPDARGLYQITLGLGETREGSGHYALVMERAPWDADGDEDNDNVKFALPAVSAGGVQTTHDQLPSDVVPLLDGVKSLEITYYDPRLNSWQDRWNDDTMIPSLVRVRLAMEDSGAPYEFIEQIPSGGLRRGLPNTALTNFAVPGVNSAGGANIPGVTGPGGAPVPPLPPGLTVPLPPAGGFPAPPPLPPGVSGPPTGGHHPVNFPNAPLNGTIPR